MCTLHTLAFEYTFEHSQTIFSAFCQHASARLCYLCFFFLFARFHLHVMPSLFLTLLASSFFSRTLLILITFITALFYQAGVPPFLFLFHLLVIWFILAVIRHILAQYYLLSFPLSRWRSYQLLFIRDQNEIKNRAPISNKKNREYLFSPSEQRKKKRLKITEYVTLFRPRQLFHIRLSNGQCPLICADAKQINFRT